MQQYLTRIATYEDKLHAAITVNPNALEEADERDRERAQGRVRGPLHGIPIALKDNIHTTDMPTTGGALAFDGLVPPYEATLTKNLREAGAIIIAKTGMTELANWVAGNMPTNYNALQGLRLQSVRSAPRSARGDLRRPAGDADRRIELRHRHRARTSGPRNVGTETSGSILSPSNQNMLAAIKPTVGRISRYGVIPITADQDTPGPMAKFVVRRGDHARRARRARRPIRTIRRRARARRRRIATTRGSSKPDGLKGARIGIPRPSSTTA